MSSGFGQVITSRILVSSSKRQDWESDGDNMYKGF